MEKLNIAAIKPNEENPRFITDAKFKKLVKSIKDFPEMLEARPLVIDEDNIVLGGNMRLKALKSAGIFEIPVKRVDGWTTEQKREFIIKDNLGYGEWDWELVANGWDAEQLEDWGLNIPQFEIDPDYAILDDEDLGDQLDAMQSGIMKAIQIPFENDHYEEAFELVKFFRERGDYVGGILMDTLARMRNEVK